MDIFFYFSNILCVVILAGPFGVQALPLPDTLNHDHNECWYHFSSTVRLITPLWNSLEHCAILFTCLVY